VLRNLVNRHDAVWLYCEIRQGQWRRIGERVSSRGRSRVLARWSDTGPSGDHADWLSVPAIWRRWGTLANGTTSFPEHVANTWLAGQPPLQAISLGCGTGEKEIEWARLGVFEHLTGIDISPARIERAQQLAKEAGLDDVLSFRVADIRDVGNGDEQFDVVLALESLHHLSRLQRTLASIATLLGPNGLLIVDDYVGPSRRQCTRAQMRVGDDLLAELLPRWREQANGRIKRRVVKPSLLSMWLDDPSEAAESRKLLSALRRNFTIVEEHSRGRVLHLALHGVAHNFLGDDPATRRVVERCLAVEEDAAHLGPDFVFAVCRPRRAVA
jgi:2-polyprenyl-3-methyl-5-hydroxy-6-metoxy-1,4-benzoquinol methylase